MAAPIPSKSLCLAAETGWWTADAVLAGHVLSGLAEQRAQVGVEREVRSRPGEADTAWRVLAHQLTLLRASDGTRGGEDVLIAPGQLFCETTGPPLEKMRGEEKCCPD